VSAASAAPTRLALALVRDRLPSSHSFDVLRKPLGHSEDICKRTLYTGCHGIRSGPDLLGTVGRQAGQERSRQRILSLFDGLIDIPDFLSDRFAAQVTNLWTQSLIHPRNDLAVFRTRLDQALAKGIHFSEIVRLKLALKNRHAFCVAEHGHEFETISYQIRARTTVVLNGEASKVQETDPILPLPRNWSTTPP
jgi:hypothetical protein